MISKYIFSLFLLPSNKILINSCDSNTETLHKNPRPKEIARRGFDDPPPSYRSPSQYHRNSQRERARSPTLERSHGEGPDDSQQQPREPSQQFTRYREEFEVPTSRGGRYGGGLAVCCCSVM